MPQVDIITGEKRRRIWTVEEKQSILAAAFAPGAVAAHVARRANISTGQLYTWRKELRNQSPTEKSGFSRVVTVTDIVPAATAGLAYELPAIALEIHGHKVRIPGTMPPALAAAVVGAMVKA